LKEYSYFVDKNMWVTTFHLIGISLTSTISTRKVGSIGAQLVFGTHQ